MPFLIALLLLLAFVANVVYGAINGTPIIGNVAEMLVLFAASIAFVVGILKKEAEASRARDDQS